jgi:glycosyltransferase involved in cell wall biosynthesis
LSLKHIHIVSFDVPFPPNYGGVIDVYFKIKALAAEGVKIQLHCFEYGRAESRELESYCEKVYYYKRDMSRRFLLSSLPYIAVTRSSEKFMEHLLKDSHPILFEGLHSCFHLSDPRLTGRKKYVRTHNIEHDYYSSLASIEKSFFRKTYFKQEAKKLKRFEKTLALADAILAISRADEEELMLRYKNVKHVSAFHPNEMVHIKPGSGTFALYHGNLEVGENNQAAMFLAEEVFAGSSIPLIIAGKKPSAELKMLAGRHPNITLKANIPTHEIDALIHDAQINILPTFQATGIKLKLLAALYKGRHCIVNTPMVANTGLETLCIVRDDAASMKEAVEMYFRKPFEVSEVIRREELLYPGFSNSQSVKKLMSLL